MFDNLTCEKYSSEAKEGTPVLSFSLCMNQPFIRKVLDEISRTQKLYSYLSDSSNIYAPMLRLVRVRICIIIGNAKL